MYESSEQKYTFIWILSSVTLRRGCKEIDLVRFMDSSSVRLDWMWWKFLFAKFLFVLRKKTLYLVTISSHATWKLISSQANRPPLSSLSWEGENCEWVVCVLSLLLDPMRFVIYVNKIGCRCMVSSMWEVLKGCLIITYFIQEWSVKNSLWSLHLFSYVFALWMESDFKRLWWR